MYKKICTTYGEYLWKSSKFEEAAAMFRLGDDFKRALDAYKRCENFQLAKTVAMLMKTPLEQIKELAEEFLNLFRNADDHKGISEVLLDMYCNKMISNKEQIEELISSLVKAQDYFKAISIASECQRPDLISGEIYKGILLGYDILYNEIISNTNGYNEKYKRLLIVQEQKKLMPTLSEDTLPMGLDTMEIASESGRSKSSRSSKSSKKSSSGRRKAQRKAVIKEGSRFEEDQIIEYLQGMEPSIDIDRAVADIKRCMEFFGCKEESMKLNNALKELKRLTKTPLLSYEQMKVTEKIPNFFEIFPKLKPGSI